MWALGGGKSVETRGKWMVFVAFEKGKRILSVTLPEVGMANAVFFGMSYFIVYLLFR